MWAYCPWLLLVSAAGASEELASDELDASELEAADELDSLLLDSEDEELDDDSEEDSFEDSEAELLLLLELSAAELEDDELVLSALDVPEDASELEKR